ncbi:rubrerythrin-like domain-containing protein [Natronococcus roseus]
MKDVKLDPSEESTYECFDCGTVVVSATAPGSCPSCGADMRNRGTPLE